MLLCLQGLAAITASLTLVMWPPSSGAVMLVPLPGGDANAAVVAALAAGAALLGPGPLPGSMVVIGDRSRIADRVRGHFILVTAAPVAGCGNGAIRAVAA